MSLLSRILSFRSQSLESPATPLTGPSIWQWLSGGMRSAAGEIVNEGNALEHLDLYVCIRILTDAVASLPLQLMLLTESGREEAFDQSLYRLLAFEPNPEMTAYSFWSAIVGAQALTGNGYAEIDRSPTGQPIALYPLHPRKTEPMRGADGLIFYRTTDGQKNGDHRDIVADDMLHFPLFCFDGLKGISPIRMAMQSVGLAKAATKFGARFFGNGSRPGGVVSVKSGANEKLMLEAKASWEQTQGGDNQGRTAFFPGDWTYTQIGLSPEESQFLETRKYQRTEMAALMGVPPHKVGDTTRLSNNNHEQEELSFVTDTVRPYCVRIEQEVARKLLPRQGRSANKYVVRFDMRERLRGDFATQSQGYALGRQWGWYNANMVLRELGENQIGAVGDVFMAPFNMMNAERLLDPPEPTPALPAPQADPNADDPPTESERNLLRGMTGVFARLFRDAIGRVCGRSKRDSAAVDGVFRPLLTSIAELAADDAGAQMRLKPGWFEGAEALVREQLQAIEKRAQHWAVESVEAIAGDEMRKAVRGISMQIYRIAGAKLAEGGSGAES
jgi:HK97 family phage portal protein